MQSWSESASSLSEARAAAAAVEEAAVVAVAADDEDADDEDDAACPPALAAASASSLVGTLRYRCTMPVMCSTSGFPAVKGTWAGRSSRASPLLSAAASPCVFWSDAKESSIASSMPAAAASTPPSPSVTRTRMAYMVSSRESALRRGRERAGLCALSARQANGRRERQRWGR